IFEFNQKNYNNTQSIFKQEAASDEDDNDFKTDFEDQVFPLPSLTSMSVTPSLPSTSITPSLSSTSVTPSLSLTSVTPLLLSTSVSPSVLVEETAYNLDPAVNTHFLPCVLIDYIDNELQTCGQTTNLKNICQLVGTWQIDENIASECQSKGTLLGA
ncbi:19463_t:CDS:2, partial [Funneliformis geosporum]